MAELTENRLENKLIENLNEIGYQYIDIHDEQGLVSNLRKQLELHNQIKVPLSDNEFKQVTDYLTKKSGFCEKAKLLHDRCLVKRDDGSDLYLTFLSPSPSQWKLNQYQVAHQINMPHYLGAGNNRFDVTLLVNGLPLVQIELKRATSTGGLQEAFNQIQRYKKESFASGLGLFEYVQLCVISNESNTKYFASTVDKIEFTFYWTDKNNTRLEQLDKFTDSFLKPSTVTEIICRYMANTQEVASSGKVINYLAVLRPYQYYAAKAIVDRIQQSNHHGYIWHTTGSGKTLTAFKVSQIAQNIEGVSKVLFVVDRKDLDLQTITQFKAYAEGNEEAVDGTANTKALLERLADDDTKPIVTTIQKLNNALKDKAFSSKIAHLKDQKVVFIFDECHRSQFGIAHHKIKKFFKKGQMFGFTGTPIFKENAHKFSVNINNNSVNDFVSVSTTADLFEECLHKYTITNAIADGNVLPFSVEYRGRYDIVSDDKSLDIKVTGIDTDEVLNSEDRLRKIVRDILIHHSNRTKNRIFNSIFCVSSVDNLIKYYRLFKEEQKNLQTDFTIATIFSYGANNLAEDGVDRNEEVGDIPDEEFETKGMVVTHKDKLKEFVADYNDSFKTNFSIDGDFKTGTDQQKSKRFGSDPNGFYAYYKHISGMVRKGKIDILLVVNMFLTGFDAPCLNTLYVDKNLCYHGLLQAYSRTNRICNTEKTEGKIVCYRNLKLETDKAIRLFADENALETVLLEDYGHYVKRYNETVDEIKKIVPNKDTNLNSEEDKRKFVKLYSKLLRLYNTIRSFSDYAKSDLKLSSSENADLAGRYLSLRQEVRRNQKNAKSSILNDVTFELDLIHRDEIDFDYINSVFVRLMKTVKEDEKSNIKRKLFEDLEKSPQYSLKRKLIEEFIEKNLENLTEQDDVKQAFEDFVSKECHKKIIFICAKDKLKTDRYTMFVDNYRRTGDEPTIQEWATSYQEVPPILMRQKKKEIVVAGFHQLVQTYVDGIF